MDHSSAQHHHQDQMSSQTLESMLVSGTKAQQQQQQDMKKPRPADQQALKCPRCDSTNTKFCYYNNYSLTQPRYFCKSCRRYWTKGGTLRNVPVGGGCRKNKRSSSSSSSLNSTSSSSSSKIRAQDHHQAVATNCTNPLSSLTNHMPLYHDSDISLAIARLQKQTNSHLGFHDHHDHHDHLSMLQGEVLGNNVPNGGFFDAFRSGGFLENNPNGFHNLYNNYGMSTGTTNGNMGLGLNVMSDQEMSSVMVHQPYDHQDHINGGNGATTTASTTVTTVKQEICSNARDHAGESTRVLWGFPWQMGGEGHNMGSHDLDSAAAGRQSNWNNGFASSNWHGLLNSPLM